MSVFVYNRLMALLALASLAGGLALAVPAVRRRVVDAGLSRPVLWVAVAVAAVATAGSLTYSGIYHFEPCRLCWYQRIAMYPLAVVLLVGVLRRDPAVRAYGLPLALGGLATSVYHYLLQTFPSLDTGACGLGVPCTGKYVNELGFISIPFMAGSGFVFIVAALAGVAARASEENR